MISCLIFVCHAASAQGVGEVDPVLRERVDTVIDTMDAQGTEEEASPWYLKLWESMGLQAFLEQTLQMPEGFVLPKIDMQEMQAYLEKTKQFAKDQTVSLKEKTDNMGKEIDSKIAQTTDSINQQVEGARKGLEDLTTKAKAKGEEMSSKAKEKLEEVKSKIKIPM